MRVERKEPVRIETEPFGRTATKLPGGAAQGVMGETLVSKEKRGSIWPRRTNEPLSLERSANAIAERRCAGKPEQPHAIRAGLNALGKLRVGAASRANRPSGHMSRRPLGREKRAARSAHRAPMPLDA